VNLPPTARPSNCALVWRRGARCAAALFPRRRRVRFRAAGGASSRRRQRPFTWASLRHSESRHDNESQRAMAAARLANLKHGQRADRAANLPVSQSAAAEMLKVSERSVRSATQVRDHAVPELSDKVDRGEVSVSAARLATLRLGANQHAQICAPSQGSHRPCANLRNVSRPRSRASEVGRRSVQSAAKVRDHAVPELSGKGRPWPSASVNPSIEGITTEKAAELQTLRV
jgi:hypothetical protein